MQYFSKVALLAVAFFSISVLALPLALGSQYDLEAREFNNDLSSRGFYDMYLEARNDPTLDARDLESLDLEARDPKVSLFGLTINFLFLIKGKDKAKVDDFKIRMNEIFEEFLRKHFPDVQLAIDKLRLPDYDPPNLPLEDYMLNQRRDVALKFATNTWYRFWKWRHRNK